MKKLIILIIVDCAFLIGTTYSQFTWQRLYDGPYNQQDACLDLCDAGNGNFFSAGWSKKPTIQGYFVYVLKLNPLGDTIWTRIIDSVSNDAMACAPSGDGGVVIVGEGHFALKLDSAGNIAWKRFYSRGGIRCYDIIKTSDGGFLACGEQLNIPLRYDSYAMKLDFDGNMVWDTVYSYSGAFDKPFNAVLEIENEGYMFTGYSFYTAFDTVKCVILKTDYTGNIIWEKNEKIFNRSAGGKKIEKLGTNYLIGGGTSDSSATIGIAFLLKLDNSGNILSVNLVNSNMTEKLTDLKILSPNRFALTTFDLIAKSMITDSTGNIIVQRSFPTQHYTYLLSVLPLPGGDILWGGLARFGAEDADVWILRSDSLLNFPPIGIQPGTNFIPTNYTLHQNFPNPFNPKTIIKFSLTERTFVNLTVYNVLGEKISELINENLHYGDHFAEFNGENLPSGVYFYRLNINNKYFDTRKMVLVK